MTNVSVDKNMASFGAVHDINKSNSYHIFAVYKTNKDNLTIKYYVFNYSIDNSGAKYDLKFISSTEVNYTKRVSELFVDNSATGWSVVGVYSIIVASSFALYNSNGSKYEFIIVVKCDVNVTDGYDYYRVANFIIDKYYYNATSDSWNLKLIEFGGSGDTSYLFHDAEVFYNRSHAVFFYLYTEVGVKSYLYYKYYDLVHDTSGSNRYGFWLSQFDFKMSNPVEYDGNIYFLVLRYDLTTEAYTFYIAKYDGSSIGTIASFDETRFSFPIDSIDSISTIAFSKGFMNIFYIGVSDVEDFVAYHIVNITSGEDLSPPTKLPELTFPKFLIPINITSSPDNLSYLLYLGAYNGDFNFYFLRSKNGLIESGNIINITLSQNPIVVLPVYNTTEGSIAVFYTAHNKTSSEDRYFYVTIGLIDDDKDSLSNIYEEKITGTLPGNNDTDIDNLLDSSELFYYHTNPLNNDTDDDGLTDYEELIYGTKLHEPDSDSDGIKDGDEIKIYETDPNDDDTDNDGLDDYTEVFSKYEITVIFANGTVITFNVTTDPIKADSDEDNLTDLEEVNLRTNPRSNDTDKDGLYDEFEVKELGTNPSNYDSDGDTLSDHVEIFVYHTNPLAKDTDGDGLFDNQEINEYHTDPTKMDPDSDGLDDFQEIKEGTDPFDNDTDDDGLLDSKEVSIGTDPLKNDTDNDGLSDAKEFLDLHTDPLSADTDKDGLDDYQEIMIYHTNPRAPDTDNDGIDDYQELVKWKTNPLKNDTDNDGISDSVEIFVYDTDPLKNDSDGDGLLDLEEIKNHHTNPADNDTDNDRLSDYDEIKVYNTNPNAYDSDSDGLSDYEELMVYGTNPLERDTDGDGLSDYDEVRVKKTDPLLIDSDGDRIPDNIDPNPTFNDLILVGIALVMLISGGFFVYTSSAGTFRDWKKDLIMLGLAESGGTPMFALPEEETTKHDPTIVSSALYGMWSLVCEISGKTQEFLVFGGRPAMIVSVKDETILWVIAKRSYKKLEKAIKKLHKSILEKYRDVITTWAGLEDNLKPVKDFIMEEIFPKKMTSLEKVELKGEVEEKELEEEITNEDRYTPWFRIAFEKLKKYNLENLLETLP